MFSCEYCKFILINCSLEHLRMTASQAAKVELWKYTIIHTGTLLLRVSSNFGNGVKIKNIFSSDLLLKWESWDMKCCETITLIILLGSLVRPLLQLFSVTLNVAVTTDNILNSLILVLVQWIYRFRLLGFIGIENWISNQVISNGLFYMAVFILNGYTYGLFPVIIGTWLLYGYFIWFIQMVIV